MRLRLSLEPFAGVPLELLDLMLLLLEFVRTLVELPRALYQVVTRGLVAPRLLVSRVLVLGHDAHGTAGARARARRAVLPVYQLM